MRRTKVVYDLDGTLNDINATICRQHNIDPRILTKYHTHENHDLSTLQKRQIMNGYNSIHTFVNTPLFTEAQELINLNDWFYDDNTGNGFDIMINTLSFTYEIAEYKREMLKKQLGFRDDQIINPVGTYKDDVEDAYILVEDNPFSIVKSGAVHNILIRKSYNNLLANKISLDHISNVYIVADLKVANQLVRGLMLTQKGM